VDAAVEISGALVDYKRFDYNGENYELYNLYPTPLDSKRRVIILESPHENVNFHYKSSLHETTVTAIIMLLMNRKGFKEGHIP